MSDPFNPTVSVTAGGYTVTIPAGDQTVLPTIPAELSDLEIPLFVLEWILESDEIATIVQELLQAPTRSLCRMMAAPTTGGGEGVPTIRGLTPRPYNSPTPPVLRKDGVLGFDAGGPAHVPGLPEGIKLPMQVFEIVQMSRKLDAWIAKGQRVTEWALEHGAVDASWLPAAS
jgi:hypothetical protein